MNNILEFMILLALTGGPQEESPEKSERAVMKKFEAVYRDRSALESDRIAAIRELGSVQSTRTAQALARPLRTGSVKEKTEAAKVLGTFAKIRKVSALLGSALYYRGNLRESGVRKSIIASLRKLREAIGFRLLLRLIRDQDYLVAAAAIRALSDFRLREAIPHCIRYLRQCERSSGGVPLEVPINSLPGMENLPEQFQENQNWDFSIRLTADQRQTLRERFLRPALIETLRLLTKQNLQTWKAWNRWWKTNGTRFRIKSE